MPASRVMRSSKKQPLRLAIQASDDVSDDDLAQQMQDATEWGELDRATLDYLDAFGSWGSEAGQFGTLHHLSADSQGNLYTAEVTPLMPVNRRVQKYVTN